MEINSDPFGFGSFLLAGLPNDAITWNMPLFRTISSFALNLEMNSALFSLVLPLSIYTLVFCAGFLLRGYWAGILSLIGVGVLEVSGAFRYDAEQSFYSFFVLLVVSLLLLRRRENTLKNSVLCGLAIGASMLVRTPLFLFPPAFILCDWLYSKERSGVFLVRSLFFLAASYILLIPWGFLNYSISGRFSLFDNRRAASLLITGAKGSIYTIEGNYRRLAGIGEGDSAFSFFVREAAENPLFYALSVLRRLWHIFLFYPLLFAFFLIAIIISRERDKSVVFCLPVYFIFIHSLLSTEERYFYPMLYVLPSLAVGSFLPGRFGKSPEQYGFAKKAIVLAFCFSFCAVLAVEALIIAYPYRSARNILNNESFMRAALRFPNDRVFQDMKCKVLRRKGDDAGFYKCLRGYSQKFGDEVVGYFFSAIASRSPSELALPPGREMECLIIRMLREFELGDRASAMVSFRQAYARYEMFHNRLLREPYKRDKELALLIKQDSDSFWNGYVYDILLMWPYESMPKIFSGLEKQITLTGRLKLLADAVRGGVLRGGSVSRLLRDITASGMWGRPSGGPCFLWKEEPEKSKELSDSAVEKMRLGDFKAVEKLLLEATEINPSNPEAFMNLCSLWVRENKKIKALEACKSAVYSVYSYPENMLPGFEILASEAAFESYKLLDSLGRKPEAAQVLRDCVKRAPAAWPGLSRAKAALKDLDR